jgi:hypothetical protein
MKAVKGEANCGLVCEVNRSAAKTRTAAAAKAMYPAVSLEIWFRRHKLVRARVIKGKYEQVWVCNSSVITSAPAPSGGVAK